MEVPKSHPRYRSLLERHRLIDGFRSGYVAVAGLIAHGRGEAFDYLLGEKTTHEAERAERAAVAMLLLSKNPVISVNGNTAALVPGDIVSLSKTLDAGIEINLFYRTPDRVKKIEHILRKSGADTLYGTNNSRIKRLSGIDSERGVVDLDGIWVSDTILVPLEDGDRTEALVGMGKWVIAIDLNPLSRTSKNATISIVDNITRAIPNMIKIADELKTCSKDEMIEIVDEFDNKGNLDNIVSRVRHAL